MQMSEFTFRLILLFIPGIIACIIVETLTVHKEIKIFRFILYSLILGFLCYLLWYVIGAITSKVLGLNIANRVYFFNALVNKNNPIKINEIIFVTFLSLPLGFIISVTINYKLLFRIAQKLRISRKYGDTDVWSYILNSNAPAWAVIRDIENDVIYEGWIQAFSDSTDSLEVNELFIRDVKAYKNSTGEFMYQSPATYLRRNMRNLVIEFTALPYTDAITYKKEE